MLRESHAGVVTHLPEWQSQLIKAFAALCGRKGCRSLRDGLAGCHLRSAWPFSEPTDRFGISEGTGLCHGEFVVSPYSGWTPSQKKTWKLVRDGQIPSEAPGQGKLQRAGTYMLSASRGCAIECQKQTWGTGAYHLSQQGSCRTWPDGWSTSATSTADSGLDHLKSAGRNEAEALRWLCLAQSNLLS